MLLEFLFTVYIAIKIILKKMYNYKDSHYCKLEYGDKDVTVKLGNAMMYIFREAFLKSVKPGIRQYREHMTDRRKIWGDL